MITKIHWIDESLLRDFEAEGTDAHRLCTVGDGWVERFGRDILISFKKVLARERLIQELPSWAKIVRFDVGRIFARFIPRKNEEREPPSLIFGDPHGNLQTIATERYLKFGIDFGAGYSAGLFVDQRENRRYVRHIAPKRILNCFAYTARFLSARRAPEPLRSMSIFPRNLWRAAARILPLTVCQRLIIVSLPTT